MSVVDDIKARLDIVETVSAYVALRKSGRYLKAACPFHSEKTPSFIVSPERQSWRCFGACATGGDVFSFVMRMERLDFAGALRLLAQKTGISISQGGGADHHEELYRINQIAARFFRDTLRSRHGETAMGYLRQRGVDESAMSSFELGLSPPGREALKSHLLAIGLREDEAVEAGLLHRREDGSSRDFFGSRLMFPIHDSRGRIAGFGARALDNSTPKYLNTPRTPVFDKRSILYGLHMAKESIRAQGVGIVVEGYMDVIAAHQHGYPNVVASMGTALTDQQVSLLKGLATDFVLALDPDTAGQEATLRSLESSWRVFERHAVDTRPRPVGALYQREPLTLKIAALPAGRDPDKLIREDAEEWEGLIREAVPLMDYLIPAVASRFDLKTARGKAQVVETLAPIIASADFFEQQPYLVELARALDVSEQALKASIGGLLQRAPRRNDRRSYSDSAIQVNESPLASKPEDSIEQHALALLLKWPELKERVREFAPEFFHNSKAREVFTHWLSRSTIDDLREGLDESLHEHLTYLTHKDLVPADRRQSEAALAQCLQRLERRHLRELQEGLLASEDTGAPPPREMEGPVSDVNAKLKQSFSQRIR